MTSHFDQLCYHCKHAMTTHDTNNGNMCPTGNGHQFEAFDGREDWEKKLDEEISEELEKAEGAEKEEYLCVCGHSLKEHIIIGKNDPRLPCQHGWEEKDATKACPCTKWTKSTKSYLNEDFGAAQESARTLFGDEVVGEADGDWNYPGGHFGQGTAGYSGKALKPFCKHEPQMIIDGKSWSIWAGAKFDCQDHALRFPLVVNLTGFSVGADHKIPVPELRHWEEQKGGKMTEILLDWTDGQDIDFPLEFWIELKDYIQKKKIRALFFCLGGHGRTGTALACLMITCGYTAASAIDFIHKHYCKEAIETKIQYEYIAEIEQQFKDYQHEKKAAKAKKVGAKISAAN